MFYTADEENETSKYSTSQVNTGQCWPLTSNPLNHNALVLLPSTIMKDYWTGIVHLCPHRPRTCCTEHGALTVGGGGVPFHRSTSNQWPALCRAQKALQLRIVVYREYTSIQIPVSVLYLKVKVRKGGEVLYCEARMDLPDTYPAIPKTKEEKHRI